MQELQDILCGWSLYTATVTGALGWLATQSSEGVVSNSAHWLTCRALGPAWKYLRKRQATEPEFNHDLQRAAREAYLRATLELLEQSKAAKALRKRVQTELDAIDRWLPAAPLEDLDALLLDENQPVESRAAKFRSSLDALLAADLESWSPGSSRDAAISGLLQTGWTVAGPDKQPVRRDWHGVISLYFIAQLKAKQPLANIFQAQLLARMHNEEPRIPADFATFSAKLDHITVVVERVEAKVDELPVKVADELAARNMVKAPRKAILDERPPAFTGRVEQIEKLREKLAMPGARILVHGEPGSGKSTLALWFGWLEAERGASVAFVTCGRRPLAQAVAEFAPKLGIDPTLPPEKQTETLRAWVQERDGFLILDDLWEDPTDLIPAAPARVLLTSRSRDMAHLPLPCRVPVGGFTPEEAEAFWTEALGAEWMPQHRQGLMDFARRADYLPYALAVSASLLSLTSRPAEEAIAGLAVGRLQDGTLDLARLLGEAVAAQSEPGQELLRAFGVCAAEGVWLPFVAEIAGLDAGAADIVADQLVNASLLRLVDREERRFAVHPLLHEWLEGEQDSVRRSRHAAILSGRFEKWESDWKDCGRLLDEVDSALRFQRVCGDLPAFNGLSYRAFQLGWRTGALEAALRFQKSAQVWAEERGDRAELSWSLGNQALILPAWGKLHEAMALLKEVERICSALGDQAGLSASLGNQAGILRAWGKLDEAMGLLKEQERICRALGDQAGLQASLGNQALILKAWGKLDEAMGLLKEQERICRALGDQAGLQVSLGNQALILQDWGKLDEAMALLKEVERICRALGDQAGLQRSLGNQALILQAWGKLDEAMALHKEKERICRALGDQAGLSASLGNQAGILQAWGKFDEAMGLLKEEERICRALGDQAGLQASLGNQALILQDWGKLDEAMGLHKEKERICRALGNQAGLQASLGNQALILKAWGKLDEAMGLHKEQERICRALGDQAGLARSLANQGLILRQQHELPEARTLFTEALRIFTELRMPRERDLVQGWLSELDG